MKIKETVVGTRNSTIIPWAWDSIDKIERDADFVEKYLVTGKVVPISETLSEDELTMTFVRIWESQTVYDDYLANPLTIDLFSRYVEYNNDNNIIVTRTTEQL